MRQRIEYSLQAILNRGVNVSQKKIDVHNGLLLCPNHDKIFDSGLITFDNNGNIMISDELNCNDRILLNLRDDMKIAISEKSIKYMEYHRKHIYYLKNVIILGILKF